MPSQATARQWLRDSALPRPLRPPRPHPLPPTPRTSLRLREPLPHPQPRLRPQAPRARAVAARAQAKDAPSAVSRVMAAAAASVVAASTLFGGAAVAADLALGKNVFDGNCGARTACARRRRPRAVLLRCVRVSGPAPPPQSGSRSISHGKADGAGAASCVAGEPASNPRSARRLLSARTCRSRAPTPHHCRSRAPTPPAAQLPATPAARTTVGRARAPLHVQIAHSLAQLERPLVPFG